MQNIEQDEFVVEHAEREQAALVVEPEDNDFIVYARRLWQARRFIVTAVLAGAVVSVIVALLLPKQYQSSARLMPPSGGSQAAALLQEFAPGPLADIGSSALGLESPSAIYLQVLQSRTVEDHLVDQFNLRRVYGVKSYEDARLLLAANTETAVDRKSDVVTIMVKAKSPQLAADLAKGYCDELNSLMVKLDTSDAHRERVFLESRLNGIHQDLLDTSTQLAQYSSKNAVLSGEEQNKAIFEGVENLRGETIIAKADLLALKQAYAPDNERVRAAQAKVDSLDRELAQIRGSNDPAETKSEDFPTIRALPLLGVKYASLMLNLKIEEAVYETLTKQYELARVQEARDLPTVRVLDPADVPEKKSFPKRALVVLAGMSLSFLLSCLYLLGQDWWRSTRSPWRRFAAEMTSGVIQDASRLPGLRRFRKGPREKTAAV